MLQEILTKVDNEIQLTNEELNYILKLENREDLKIIFDKAYEIKEKYIGRKSFFRGLIELSNVCIKDCYYCGIRKSNHNIERYTLTEKEVLDCALWAHNNHFGSIVLQSGERVDEKNADFIENLLYKIKDMTEGKLGITLSLGEQSEEVYKRWYNAGGHRYLLRIETTNKELYKTLHPEDHNFDERIQCLHTLRKLGYQVGSGVMVGLPGQTIEDLVNDIIFFKEFDIDMIGMGPYIEHKDTPLAGALGDYEKIKRSQYLLGLKMIAAVRLYLRDINIASTTALQALNQFGREMGLKAGANILMPNISPTKYRESYKLYDGKPCTDEDSDLCKDCMSHRITGIEEEIGFNEWGDSPRFLKRNENKL